MADISKLSNNSDKKSLLTSGRSILVKVKSSRDKESLVAAFMGLDEGLSKLALNEGTVGLASCNVALDLGPFSTLSRASTPMGYVHCNTKYIS